MKYQEWRDSKQKEFNALPIFYAFSEKQFAEAMQERGLKPTDTDKVYRLGMGGYYLRSDAPIIRAYMEQPDKLSELMKDPEWAEDAFYEEMLNHEYAINWQADYDVCSCFCDCRYSDNSTYVDYLRAGGYSDEVIEAYRRAKKRHMQMALDNEWF